MICHSCHFQAMTQIAGFMVYGCRKHKWRFGLYSDWKAGKWQGNSEMKKLAKVKDMPSECVEYKQSII